MREGHTRLGLILCLAHTGFVACTDPGFGYHAALHFSSYLANRSIGLLLSKDPGRQ